MARRFGFKPPLRQTMLGTASYIALMSRGGALPADLQRSLAKTLPPLPRVQQQRKGWGTGTRTPAIDHSRGLDIDAIHGSKRTEQRRDLEGPVVKAISELLAVHPKVLFAVRQNSGMASYEAKSGRYAPVFFYRILTHAKDMTLPDFWGILKDGRLLAVEAKAPGWKKISGERELRQEMFLMLVRNCGGVALFATSADEVARALNG